MKQSDIQKLYEAQLITDEQRQRIIEHFGLNGSKNKFLVIMVSLGGVLALAGIILVISAHWGAIPGLVKIALGAMLMAGAHAAGWYLCGTRQSSPKLGGALHFLGAGLFLANIALVGQVYHLSSRAPNAMILWLAGIIPLAWVLRSRSIHVLSLIGLTVWLGMEINCEGGWLYFASCAAQVSIFSGFGLLLYGAGLTLGRSSYPEFRPATERLGLLLFQLGLCWTVVDRWWSGEKAANILALSAAAAIPGLLLALLHFRKEKTLSAQWRAVWCAVLACWTGLIVSWPFLIGPYQPYYAGRLSPFHWMASVALVVGCLLQIRAAVEMRAAWMVNLAIVGIAFTLITDFILLMGSMLNTGMIFLVGGVGLLGLGYILERKRRSALRKINL